jgi:pimeloyl-ACP methyl ester carboxylesterase
VTLLPNILHRYIDVDGTRIFYREAVPVGGAHDSPVLLLLHGFPTASHQYRRLMDAIGGTFRIIAPDYPGFGHSDAPLSTSDGGHFTYRFERLADVMERLLENLALTRFAMYVFDFGGPVGFRLAVRHPEWISGLIIQNANSYSKGLSSAARDFIAIRVDDDGAQARVREMLTLEATRGQYLTGTLDAELVCPDDWTLDQHFLDLPGRDQPQLDLAFDYHTNIEQYPAWQSWFRGNTPPTLIVWGRHDPFFVEAGAWAYRSDLPDAEVHLLDTGHFALQECLPTVAALAKDFLNRI